MAPVIQIENISKLYRLGEVSTGTLSHDLNRWWQKLRGKEDPYLKIGQLNDRTRKSAKSDFNGRESGGGSQESESSGTTHSSPTSENPTQTYSQSNYVYALKDINFSVNQGEVLGIIGRNGAGKSTLLKILSRVTAPTSGQIKVKGRIASLLEVGTGFHPELTGRENIFLNGAILGMRRHEIKRKLDEIVDFSGCAAYLDTPVKRYSSGMYVRLAFAVAAHLEPEILIVDEVLAVGDLEFQAKCLGRMKTVAGEGTTVIFVSHNIGAIETLCSSAVEIVHGRVDAFSSKTSDVVSRYLKRSIETTTRCPIALTEYLTITQLECLPDPAIVREHASITLSIDLTRPIRATDFSLLIHDAKGNRCTILDARTTLALPITLPAGKTTYNFSIPSLALTPSNYRIGLYLRSEQGEIDSHDLGAITVQHNGKQTFTPYSSEYCGTFISDFSLECTHKQLNSQDLTRP